MENELLSRINANYSSMSKGQKFIANYIIDYYDKAVFYTAAKLGEIVGVSESTVVRFATMLGYKGYPQFQEALEVMISDKLENVPSLQVNATSIEENSALSSVINSDINKLTMTLKEIDKHSFDVAVENIILAKRIYVIGLRNCACLADYFAFYLRQMFDDVVLLSTNSSSEIFEQMMSINEQDVIIGISFPRYSMRTLKALEFANERRARIISITDNIHSPLNLYSSCNLVAHAEMTSIVAGLTAPFSVINALIVAITEKRREEVTEHLEELERVWDLYQIHDTDEIDLLGDSVRMHYTKVGDNNE